MRPNGFKAQVVAPSRAAALSYSRNLNNFGVRAYPIITTSASDGPEFQEVRGLNQDQVTNAFVDPTGEPEVLVVVDMLLTGSTRRWSRCSTWTEHCGSTACSRRWPG